MSSYIFEKAREFLRDQKKKKIWYRLTTSMAALVVFITTYMLILPAITMEKELICGLEEHVHSDSCYGTQTRKVLNCDYDTLKVHTHTKECEDENGNLICMKADYLVHTHDAYCYDANGNLICTLPEIKEHKHEDSCYAQPVLVCGLTEQEGHVHGDSCYYTEEVLVCGNGTTLGGGELVIDEEGGETAHVHTAECWQTNRVLGCSIPESAGHYHSASCYAGGDTLICGYDKWEIKSHQHSESCYTEVTEQTNELVCKLEEHTHSDNCYEVKKEEKQDPQEVPELTTEISGNSEEIVTDSEPESDMQTDLGEADSTEIEADQIEISTELTNETAVEEKECQTEEIEIEEVTTETGEEQVIETSADDATLEMLEADGTENEMVKVLTCTTEHEHEDTCYMGVDKSQLVCGLEEHIHNESCYNADGQLVCEVEEHEHTMECIYAVIEESETEILMVVSSAAPMLLNASDAVVPTDFMQYITSVTGSGTSYDEYTDTFESNINVGFALTKKDIVDANYTFSFDYPEGIIIPDDLLDQAFIGRDSNKVEGFTYTFSKNEDGTYKVTIVFDEEYISKINKDETEVTGSFYFAGKIAGSELDENGDIKAEFNDNLSLIIPSEDIQYDQDETRNYDISVTKSGTRVEGNKLYYTVEVYSAKGTPDEIDLTDVLSANGISASEITNVTVKEQEWYIYKNKNGYVWSEVRGSAVEVDSTTYTYSYNADIDTLTMKLPQVTGTSVEDAYGIGYTGKKYIITYEYQLEDTVDGESYVVDNTVSVSSETTGEKVSASADAEISFTGTTFSKGGYYSNGKIKWTIDVNPDGNDIAGAQLTDTMFAGLSASDISVIPSDGVAIVTDANGNLAIQFSELEGQEENRQHYTIVYEVDADEKWDATTVTNEAEFDPTPESDGDEIKETETVNVPSDAKVEKTLVASEDAVDNKIPLTWLMKITAPSDGVIPAGTVIKDTLSGNGSDHYMTIEQVNAWAESIGASEISDASMQWLSNVDTDSLMLQKADGTWVSYSEMKDDTTGLKFIGFSFTLAEDVCDVEEVALSYQSYADIAEKENDTKYYFKNKVEADDKSDESTFTYENESKVIKMDGNGNSGASATVSSDGIVTWKVKVNLDSNYEYLTITDTLPTIDGVPLELIEISYGSQYNQESATITGTTIIGNENSSITASGTIEDGVVTLNVSPTELENRPECLTEGNEFWVTYKCKITDLPLSGSQSYTLVNNVDVDTNEGDYGEDSQEQGHTVTVQPKVTKMDGNGSSEDSYTVSSNGIVTWKVKIDLDEDLLSTDVLTIEDTLPLVGEYPLILQSLQYGYQYGMVSASIDSEGAITGNDAYLNLTDCKYESSTGKITLNLSLKENLSWVPSDYKKGGSIYIVYTCKIPDVQDLEEGETVTYELKNAVTVKKNNNPYGEDDHTQNHEVTIPDRVIKMDGYGNSNDETSTSSTNGVVSWKVKVYLTDNFTTMDIIDQLPVDEEGKPLVELVSLTYGSAYSQLTATIDETGNIIEAADSPVSLDGSNYDLETGKVTLHLQVAEGQSRPDYFSDGNEFYVTYTCKIKELPSEGNQEYTLTNHVEVETDNEPYDEDDQTQKHTVTVPDKVAKMDGNFNLGSSSTSSTDGVVTWKILVNLKEDLKESLTIIDQLPLDEDGIPLVELLTLAYGTESSQVSATIGDSEEDTSEKVITGAEDDQINVSGIYDPETGKITLNVTVKEGQEVPDYLKEGGSFWITYTCQIKNLPANGKPVYTLNNIVTVNKDDKEYGSDNQEQEHTVNLPEVQAVDKNGVWDNSSRQLDYTVEINPGAQDLLEGGDTLTLTDVLTYRKDSTLTDGCDKDISIIHSSVNLYYAEVDENGVPLKDENGNLIKGEALAIQDWTWNYTTEEKGVYNNVKDVTNTLTAKIPDGVALIFEYSYLVQLVVPESYWDQSPEIQISNTATLAGVSNGQDSSYSKDEWKEVSTGGNIETGENENYKFYKVDSNDFALLLDGAEFTLYQYDPENYDSSDTNAVEGYVSTGWVYVTEDGSFVIQWPEEDNTENGYTDFVKNTAYYVVETKAPDGYEMPEEPTKFYFHFPDETVETSSYPEDFEASAAVNLEQTSHVEYCSNTKIPTHTYSIKKVDKSDKTVVLQGAEFELCMYDTETGAYVPVEPAVIYTTDSKGNLSVAWTDFEFCFNTAYCLREISAPEGYILPDLEDRPVFEFQFAHSNTEVYVPVLPANFTGMDLAKYSVEVECVNEKAPEGQYPFVKTDSEDGSFLPGAEFTLYEYTGDESEPYAVTGKTYVTGEDGTFTVKWESTTEYEFQFDTAYYVVETKAPDGYEMPENPTKYYFWFSSDAEEKLIPEDFEGIDLSEQETTPAATVVENKKLSTGVQVNKVWKDADGNELQNPPDSVSVELWRYALPEEEWEKLEESGNTGTNTVTVDVVLCNGYNTNDVWYQETISCPKGSTLNIVLNHNQTYEYNQPEVTFADEILNGNRVETETGQNYVYQVQADSSGTLLCIAGDGFSENWSLNVTYSNSSVEVEELSAWLESNAYETVLLDSSNNWQYEWSDLPVSQSNSDGTRTYYKYIVREDEVYGYNKSIAGGWDDTTGTYSFTVTNTEDETVEKSQVSVMKKWQDETGAELTDVPGSVTAELWRYEIPDEVWETLPDSVTGGSTEIVTLTYNIHNDWSYVNGTIECQKGSTITIDLKYNWIQWGSLPTLTAILNDDTENPLSYEIAGDSNEIVRYTFNISASSSIEIVSNNSSAMAYDFDLSGDWITVTPPETSSDSSEESVDLSPYAESSAYKTQTLNIGNNWFHTWKNLPVTGVDANGNGVHYKYFVKEQNVTGYISSIVEETDESGYPVFTITNTKDSTIPEYTLPETGGPGTQWYTFGGAAIALFAALLMYINKRRKEVGRTS